MILLTRRYFFSILSISLTIFGCKTEKGSDNVVNLKVDTGYYNLYISNLIKLTCDTAPPQGSYSDMLYGQYKIRIYEDNGKLKVCFRELVKGFVYPFCSKNMYSQNLIPVTRDSIYISPLTTPAIPEDFGISQDTIRTYNQDSGWVNFCNIRFDNFDNTTIKGDLYSNNHPIYWPGASTLDSAKRSYCNFRAQFTISKN